MLVTSFKLAERNGSWCRLMFGSGVLFLAAVTCCVFSGCKKSASASPFLSRVDDYKFERSDFENVSFGKDSQLVSARFDSATWSDAMRVLSDQAGASIVWSRDCDMVTVSGTFFDVPLSSVLDSLSRRAGLRVLLVGGVYYLGMADRSDRVTAVVPMVPVDSQELRTALTLVSSEFGSISVIGSFIWIQDRLDVVQKVLADLELIRERASRVYLAEVYFLRLSEDDFIELTGKLKVNAVDVFSSQFNVEQLFSMFLDAAATSSRVKVDQRPILFLSEGRASKLTVGSEVVRERRVIRENGVTEVAGYERFNDGLNLSLTCSRVSTSKYMLDFDLTVSTFGKTSGTLLPPLDKSDLKSEGMLLEDGRVYYVGSLHREHKSKSGGLFSFGGNRLRETMTIWVRVRELQGEKKDSATVSVSEVGERLPDADAVPVFDKEDLR
ncbi:MAG: hypothetical protein ACRC46_13305 [Thermoguttaceae bacterium]